MAGPIGSSQFMYNSSGASGFYPYQIEQSLRFDADNSGTTLQQDCTEHLEQLVVRPNLHFLFG